MNNNLINQFGLTARDMQTFEGIFMKYPEVEEVHLFGSRAKGNYKKGSDVDLAIMNSGFSESSLLQLKSDFEDSSLPYSIDIINFSTLKHKELLDHIQRVGILFYKRQKTQDNSNSML